MEDDSHVVSLYLMQTNYSTGVKERVDCFRPTEEYERKAQTNNYCKCTSMNLEALTVGIYIYIYTEYYNQNSMACINDYEKLIQ